MQCCVWLSVGCIVVEFRWTRRPAQSGKPSGIARRLILVQSGALVVQSAVTFRNTNAKAVGFSFWEYLLKRINSLNLNKKSFISARGSYLSIIFWQLSRMQFSAPFWILSSV